MPQTFFTTADGDIILRASSESGSGHDFRVHRFILGLASPVFKDMFSLPQPPAQDQTEEQKPPIVDVTDPPEVLDAILRFVYPGVDLPKFTTLSFVSASLSTVDKYDLASMRTVLRDSLRTFLPRDSFQVYTIACRFGFLEEAKVAAMVSTPRSTITRDYKKEIQHLSSEDLSRFLRFVLMREDAGRSTIRSFLGASSEGIGNDLGDEDDEHWDQAKGFYLHLTKAAEDAFAHNPCLELKDMLVALDKIPDPPHGCEPWSDPAEYCHETDCDSAFSCPLQPMFIRRIVTGLVQELKDLNLAMLEEVFGEEPEVGR